MTTDVPAGLEVDRQPVLCLVWKGSSHAGAFRPRGRIVKSGGKELALELEAKGYAQYQEEAA